MRRLFLLPLTALLLSACTGTEENPPAIRLAVLTDGGGTLRTVTTGGGGAAPAPTEPSVGVTGGVTVDTLPGGRRVALTLLAGLESRDANLGNAQPFAPPFDAPGFVPPCLKATVLNAQRDRLLTLSQCGTGGAANGTQQLALYRTDGTLVWRAALPVAFASTDPDAPPTRLALSRDENGTDIGIVARPALGGGSEVLRVAATTTGAVRAEVSSPVATPAIRDLAPAPGGRVIYAATDAGVQPLSSTGVPDGAATLAAFGSARVDRLWTGAGSGVNNALIAAWRDTALTGSGSEPLRLWDGARTTAAVVAYLSNLRDVTLAPDGNLYALTATTLTSYDVLFGLTQNNWRASTLLSGLNDARAVTWLVP